MDHSRNEIRDHLMKLSPTKLFISKLIEMISAKGFHHLKLQGFGFHRVAETCVGRAVGKPRCKFQQTWGRAGEP